MIQSVVELGHKMQMRVIIEGVEDEAQSQIVREMGADEAQGYLLGRPCTDPAVQFSQYFDDGRPVAYSEAATTAAEVIS